MVTKYKSKLKENSLHLVNFQVIFGKNQGAGLWQVQVTAGHKIFIKGLMDEDDGNKYEAITMKYINELKKIIEEK
jgi:hypothetical protein